MLPLPPRSVTLLLCRADGGLLGTLPPFEVTLPWWQEVRPVVDGARVHHGIDVTVLRLVAAEPSERCAGGPVTYLAEVDDSAHLPTRPWCGGPIDDDPLRASWARPGGPAADLAWADAELTRLGMARRGPAEQVRSWNLSSLWRLPIEEGAAWLKVVPPFFAHEGRALSLLDPADLPPLLATAGPRLLLAEVPGEDQYEASGEALLPMVRMLVRLQVQCLDRVQELLGAGLPDWRGAVLTDLAAAVVARRAGELDRAILATLDRLLAGLSERWEEVATCGLSDTLVHGDFHRGNVRGTSERLVLLDWGDCGIGHPMLDQAAFLAALSADDQAAVRTAWVSAWRDAIPNSDPSRAATLLEPVAALRQATIYQAFLDGIEPDERIYHAHDPAIWLRRAAALVRPGG